MNVFVYVIQEADDGDVKIGIAERPHERLRRLQTGNSRELRLLYCERASDKRSAARIERWLHEEFAGHRIRGEWFRFVGSVRHTVRQCTDARRTLIEQIEAWQSDAGLGHVA